MSIGVVSILAAIAGGGLKALNVEVPVLQHLIQQILFGLLGVGLFCFGLYVHFQKPPSAPTGINVKLDPIGDVTGRCPGFYPWQGSISITGGQGDVQYRSVFEPATGGENANGTLETIHFDEPGTLRISDTIEYSGDISGYLYVEVVEPVQTTSGSQPLGVQCLSR
jgi:hypothetical protein